MNEIRVLVWWPFYWMDWRGLSVEKNTGIEYRDKSEFGFIPHYNSQKDFDRILQKYNPDFVFLWNITSRNIGFDIPESIKVITYCDHFYEQFTLLGKHYFEQIPENNYLYIPILDADRIDKDKVLNVEAIKEKIYFAPFVGFIEEDCEEVNLECNEKYTCDLSVVSNYKNIEYFYGGYSVNEYTVQGQILMHFISELVILIRNEIRRREAICLELDWIIKTIVNTFNKLGINLYVRDKNKFIEIWTNALRYNVIPHEYMNCVVDWLIEGGYNLKIVGKGWEKVDKYRPYTLGEIKEGAGELRKIYRYSKINIGTNVNMGIHRRNIEVISNDCLCFQAEAGRDEMFSDYRHFFEDERSIVIYRNKKELYEKIDFYLSNDQKREQIIKAGKNVIEQKLQERDILGKVIKEIYGKE